MSDGQVLNTVVAGAVTVIGIRAIQGSVPRRRRKKVVSLITRSKVRAVRKKVNKRLTKKRKKLRKEVVALGGGRR